MEGWAVVTLPATLTSRLLGVSWATTARSPPPPVPSVRKRAALVCGHAGVLGPPPWLVSCARTHDHTCRQILGHTHFQARRWVCRAGARTWGTTGGNTGVPGSPQTQPGGAHGSSRGHCPGSAPHRALCICIDGTEVRLHELSCDSRPPEGDRNAHAGTRTSTDAPPTPETGAPPVEGPPQGRLTRSLGGVLILRAPCAEGTTEVRTLDEQSRAPLPGEPCT